jgi:hypothetical protein
MEVSTSDDMNAAAALCRNAADAALDRLLALGPRPKDTAKGQAWDHNDALLKNKIAVLTNQASSMSALIVSQALSDIWPNLDGLTKVTAAAQAEIKSIKAISDALTALASVINFGLAILAVATQPTPTNAGNVVAAFQAVLKASTSHGKSADGPDIPAVTKAG